MDPENKKTNYYPKCPPIVWKNDIYSIALTGTIASGKSSIAQIFSQLGAVVLYADDLAKKQLENKEVQKAIQNSFGKEIYSKDKDTFRKNLSKEVFSNQEKLEKLNQIIHPRVRKEYQKAYNKLSQGDIFVYEIPLLFEKSPQLDVDLRISVDAPQKLRYQRALKRNQWSWQEFIDREAKQFSSKEKNELADLVIINFDEKKNIKGIIQNIYKLIRSKEKKKNET